MGGLIKVCDRVWYLPHESERDRPCLGYVHGDRWSLAVDAGHSADHLATFYETLRAEGLPLPALTVLTHWHWDHTLAMHATSGLCVANGITNDHLRDLQERVRREGAAWLYALDDRIALEYAYGGSPVVSMADLTFRGEMTLDLGGCAVRLFQAPSPHTDDTTLVYVEEERVLFYGDAKSGVFPTWRKDRGLSHALAEVVAGLGCDVCIGGHWEPMSSDELVSSLACC